jgi:crotonobetainyl-CoA:carnitine CoA-transferase CaiB-like acyl-CoA transferase
MRTADGYITIGATSPRNWTALCEALGLQHLERDPRFANVAARRQRYQELAAIIEDVTRTQPSEHWYRLLEEAGVPCGVLNRIDQVVDDPHVRAREFVRDLPHTKLGRVRVTGSPMRFSRTPVRLDHAGPLLGEHTLEVLGELGLDERDVADLEEQGVVAPGTVPGARLVDQP